MAAVQAETVYSKEDAIATITSFYKFLQGVHSENSGSSSLVFPPLTGWPEITRDLFPYFTDTALELVQHLPYFTDDETFCIIPDTKPMNYTSGLLIRYMWNALTRREENGFEEEVDIRTPFPPHFVQLGRRGQYGSAIYLDTERGVIIDQSDESQCSHTDRDDLKCYLEHRQAMGHIMPKIQDIDKFGTDCWMIAPASRIDEYFEGCKEAYRQMRWMPVLDGENRSCGQCQEHDLDCTDPDDTGFIMLQIMKDAGWPGDGDGGGWDKESAERAMETAIEDYYKSLDSL